MTTKKETAIQFLLYTILLNHLGNTLGCRTGDLRTVRGDDPSDNRRYPLYCYNGEWRRICTAGFWKDSSARVACRQLGYSGLIARGYGCPGSFTVRLSSVCSGTESGIQDCGSGGMVPHNCPCRTHAWLKLPNR